MGKGIYKKAMVAVLLGALLSGCVGGDEGESGLIALSGSLSGGAASSKIGASEKLGSQSVDFGGLKIYCVSFSDPPQIGEASIGLDGSFIVNVPAHVPLGCFINDAATNQSLASLVIDDGVSGYAGNSSSTLNLSGSINVGPINLDLDTGVAKIPHAAIAPQLGVPGTSLDVAGLHDSSYIMSCVNSGNLLMDDACAQFVAGDGDTVYMRVMQGTRAGATAYGLGVWRSKPDFLNCGGIDLMDSEKTYIETSDDFTFTSVVTGASFVDDQIACETRDGLTPTSMEDPRQYYAAGPLVESGGTYTLNVGGDREIAPGCQAYERTSVNFTPESNLSHIGSFTVSSHYVEDALSPGACGGNISFQAVFVVRFTKQ